jgi:hypothetical protein
LRSSGLRLSLKLELEEVVSLQKPGWTIAIAYLPNWGNITAAIGTSTVSTWNVDHRKTYFPISFMDVSGNLVKIFWS